MLAILVIAGAVFALWAIQTAIGKATNAVDRAVRKDTYNAGKSEANATLSFSAPIPPKELISKIVAVVNAHDAAPPVVGGLYLKHRKDKLAQFAFGSKFGGDNFEAAVRLDETNQGCRGVFEILAWKESGATVQGKDEMKRLRTRIEDAVKESRGEIQ